MQLEHCFVWQSLEVVTVNNEKTYVVDRRREELRNIHDPSETLRLAQRQVGRTPTGGMEVLELYQNENDDSQLVVLDSSPEWLESLKQR